jgi:hypothetical protein
MWITFAAPVPAAQPPEQGLYVPRLTQSAWLLTPQWLFWPAAARKVTFLSFVFGRKRPKTNEKAGFSALPQAKNHCALAQGADCVNHKAVQSVDKDRARCYTLLVKE